MSLPISGLSMMRRMRLEPMKPAPPVTSKFMDEGLEFGQPESSGAISARVLNSCRVEPVARFRLDDSARLESAHSADTTRWAQLLKLLVFTEALAYLCPGTP